MAKLSVFTTVFLPFFFFFFSSSIATAAPKKAISVARKEDIPFIRCQVCEKIAHQIHNQVKAKESEISPKKVSEYQIIEIAENVCNLKKQEADWILQIDIVEKGDKLELVEQGVEGQCNSECKTIERACQEVTTYPSTALRYNLASLLLFVQATCLFGLTIPCHIITCTTMNNTSS